MCGGGVSHTFPILFYVGLFVLGAGVVMGWRGIGDKMATVVWACGGAVMRRWRRSGGARVIFCGRSGCFFGGGWSGGQIVPRMNNIFYTGLTWLDYLLSYFLRAGLIFAAVASVRFSGRTGNAGSCAVCKTGRVADRFGTACKQPEAVRCGGIMLREKSGIVWRRVAQGRRNRQQLRAR